MSKSFGAVQVTDNLSLNLEQGEFHAIIGPNGAGKTSLIAQISGTLRPDSGRVLYKGQSIITQPIWQRRLMGIARSFQMTSIFPEFTVEENIIVSMQAHKGSYLSFWKDKKKEKQLRTEVAQILNEIGLASRAEIPASNLSHGERRQLELGIAIAERPSLLLLDEPMAGMGVAESSNIVNLLQRLKGQITILLVEHDMDVVFFLADRITVMVYGKIIASGTPREIKNNADVQAAYLGSAV
ncbi:MAG: ABC transporter ATP-binding protein [Alphaproteobacteria bacterium]